MAVGTTANCLLPTSFWVICGFSLFVPAVTLIIASQDILISRIPAAKAKERKRKNATACAVARGLHKKRPKRPKRYSKATTMPTHPSHSGNAAERTIARPDRPTQPSSQVAPKRQKSPLP